MNSGVDVGGAEPIDGRRARGQRSRALIAKAMLELAREQEGMPTMEAVADRAGVSRRSVFRHFTDISELLRVVYTLQREDVFRRFPLEEQRDWTEDERVAAMVQRAGGAYEHVWAVRQAAADLARDYPVLDALMREDDAVHRTILQGLCHVTLGRLDEPRRARLLAALMAASSWTTWAALRRDQGLSVDEARAVMTFTLHALLAKARAEMAAGA